MLGQWGYDVDLHYNRRQVAVIAQDLGAVMGGNTTVATVSKEHEGWFSMFDVCETPLDAKDWSTICKVCQDLATTPLEERGEIKRWWQRL
ncbi:MAG TPA: hypothetical protein H9792_01405 [Candidatus Limosilactobacillus excrementigallinarum]|nr:hypothetical protein [Candidatus Limosilactobacillus excrementigallinarum]